MDLSPQFVLPGSPASFYISCPPATETFRLLIGELCAVCHVCHLFQQGTLQVWAILVITYDGLHLWLEKKAIWCSGHLVKTFFPLTL